MNSMNNGTEGTSGSPVNVIGLVLSVFVMVIPGVTANSLAIYCILPDLRANKTQVKQLLLVLCVLDFCGCVGVLCFRVVNVIDNVPFAVCSCVSFLTTCFPMLSGAVATFLAAERYVALRLPYWYQTNMSAGTFRAPLAAVVIFGTAICLLPQVGLGVVMKLKQEGEDLVYRCGTFPDGRSDTVKESVFIIVYGSVGLVVVALNVTLNIAVIWTLDKMKKRINPNGRKNVDTSQEFEMTKMLLALSATFIVCWLPLNLHMILVEAGVKQSSVWDFVTKILVALNFVIDPLIYLFMKKRYRQKMRQLCCNVRPRTAGEHSVPVTKISHIT